MAKSSFLTTAILLSGLALCFPAIGVRAQSTAPVIATAEFSEDPSLRCDILEVKRVSGGALNIRWRIVNTAGAPGGLTAAQGKAIPYRYSWDQIYYTDPAENKKYSFLTDSGGNRILQVFEGNYAPGQQRMNWAKFPAPPNSSQKITVYIPNFPPFEDVPVSP